MISEGITETIKTSIADDVLISGLGTSPAERRKYEAYLFDAHSYYIKLATARFGIKNEDAIDAYADSIIAVIDQIRRGHFRGESKLSSYLYQVYRNKCSDYNRKGKTQKNQINWTDEFPEIGDATKGILQSFIDRDNVARLMHLLNKMGGTCKEILLYWGEGFSLAEISKALNFKDAGSVKSRKYKCLKHLKQLYKHSKK